MIQQPMLPPLSSCWEEGKRKRKKDDVFHGGTMVQGFMTDPVQVEKHTHTQPP